MCRVTSKRPLGGTITPASMPSAASRVSISRRMSRSPLAHEAQREHEREPELVLVRVEPAGALVEAPHLLANRSIALFHEGERGARRRIAMVGRRVYVVLELAYLAFGVAEGTPVTGRRGERMEVGDDDAAARSTRARELGVRRDERGQVAEDEPAPYHVEGTGGDGQRAHVRRREQLAAGRLREHPGGQVYPDGQRRTGVARIMEPARDPASDVEHAVPDERLAKRRDHRRLERAHGGLGRVGWRPERMAPCGIEHR